MSVLSVFLKKDRDRMVLYFFVMLALCVFALLLYSGVFVLILGTYFLALYIPVYYFYHHAQAPGAKGSNIRPWELAGAIIAVAALGFWFYRSSALTVTGLERVETITILNYLDVAAEYFQNYYLLIVLLMGAIFVSLVWFILIIDKRRQ
ncbi:MAG: hypothetical protein U5N58_12460 [Actinomycetota bacterium]|nr:hypothetical protein [Actinomycetota bacterium]